MLRNFSWFIAPLWRSHHNIWDTKILRQFSSKKNLNNKCVQTVHNNWLFDCAPAFHINGDNVQVLSLPSDFYDTLKNNIFTAKERITLASLYLGTGPLEEALVTTIKDCILKARKEKTDLKVCVLLDHVRGSRGQSTNSRTMLLPLIKQFPENVQLSLYHNPNFRGILRLLVPEKFNETIGVSHLKVYLTDNTFILSGANLSEDYFINRQDRYIVVRNSPEIADYFDDLVSVVSKFSLTLNSDNTTHIDDNFTVHPFQGRDGGRDFKRVARDAINNFTDKWRDIQNVRPSTPESDTVVFPLLQMGPLGITQDEMVTCHMFESARRGSTSFLATGYFNLTDNYLNKIILSEGNFQVLCAHPEANGFYKARGIIGGVTDAFTQFAKEFYKKVVKSKQMERFVLKEYLRNHWTFHVKGLWYQPPNEERPCLTMIGSPNFGHRSVTRDLENQIVLLTDNEALQEELRQECENVYMFGVDVDEKTFKLKERRVPLWAWIVTRFTRSFF